MEEQKEEKIALENKPKLFGKWNYEEILVKDPCFVDYIAVSNQKSQVNIPHTAGRYQIKRFRKAQCPIVERLVNAMTFHGRNTGKKAMAIRIVKHAFDIINLLTGRNPLEVYVTAL